MSTLKTLACPSCNAPLSITGDEAEITCQYCGSKVFVPPEMRVRDEDDDDDNFDAAEYIDPRVANTLAVVTSATNSANRGCIALFILAVVGLPLLITAGIIYATTQGVSAI